MDNHADLKAAVIDENIKVHAAEAHVYERIHPQLFNWYQARKSARDMEFIFRELGTVREMRILDLGCGTGYLTMQAAGDGRLVTAVDLSKEMLAVLEKKLTASGTRNVTMIHMEGETFLSSNPGPYDLVMTSAFLHHLFDFKGLLTLALDNLKPGGLLYIAYEPLKQGITSRVRFALHRVVRWCDMHYFERSMKRAGLPVDDEHEQSLADYQSTLGGIDPTEIASFLKGKGEVLKLDRFATRASGFLACISDRVIGSQNTFSIIFRKS